MRSRPMSCLLGGLIAAVLCGGIATAQDDDDFPAKDLLKSLTVGVEADKQAALDRFEAQWGQHERAHEVLIEAIRRNGKRAILADSTMRMVQMLEKYDHPDVIEFLIKLLKAKPHKIVMLAVDTLGKHRAAEAAEAIIELHKRDEYPNIYGFRKCVIEALLLIEDKRCVEFLIAQLPNLQGQLQFDAVRYLAHVSLQQFATNAAHWQTWWDDNRDDFEFTENDQEFSLEATEPADFYWPHDVPEFYGVRIYAKRLVFVIDRSSSMKAGGQETRLARAKRELIETIQQLADDTHFDIVIFDARTRAWRPKLVQATEETKDAAIKFVTYIELGKGTASYDALDHSFRVDGNTEAVFFLSDGAPSAGRIVEPNEIIRVVTKENFFRRIVIYSIGISARGAQEAFMRELAVRNNGQYQGVN